MSIAFVLINANIGEEAELVRELETFDRSIAEMIKVKLFLRFS